MTIGDVFARAWDLWRRSVGWLILAGLVVGAIMALTFAIVYGVFLALIAGAASSSDSLMSDSGSSLSGLGAGMLGILGLIVYAVAMFFVQVVGDHLLRRHVRDGHRRVSAAEGRALRRPLRRVPPLQRLPGLRARPLRGLHRPQPARPPPVPRRPHRLRGVDLDHHHLAVRAAADRRPGCRLQSRRPATASRWSAAPAGGGRSGWSSCSASPRSRRSS